MIDGLVFEIYPTNETGVASVFIISVVPWTLLFHTLTSTNFDQISTLFHGCNVLAECLENCQSRILFS